MKFQNDARRGIGLSNRCATCALRKNKRCERLASRIRPDIERVSFSFLFSRIDKRVEGTSDYRGPIDSQCHCPSGLFDTCDDNIPASSLFTAYVHVDSRGWNITQLQERKRGELSESAMAT